MQLEVDNRLKDKEVKRAVGEKEQMNWKEERIFMA